MLSDRTMISIADACAYALPNALSERVTQGLYDICYRWLGRNEIHRVAQLARLTLGEPSANAQAIACACYRAKGRQRRNYRAMGRRTTWRSAQLLLPPSAYQALADTRRPLVLLTIHQGDYLAGLLSVLAHIPIERNIHIIKYAEWSKKEERAYQHFRRFGHELVVHRLSERPAKRIVRALKRQAVLLTFVDVPRSFGATTPVQMFGLPFQLTSGPLLLARLAGARILPLFSAYSDSNQPLVESGELLRTADFANPTKRAPLTQLAQQLADQLEANLRRHGTQWEMWPVLADLLDRERLEENPEQLDPALLLRLAVLQ
jgi:lauroyl/myristoyl acyltransferase